MFDNAQSFLTALVALLPGVREERTATVTPFHVRATLDVKFFGGVFQDSCALEIPIQTEPKLEDAEKSIFFQRFLFNQFLGSLPSPFWSPWADFLPITALDGKVDKKKETRL